MTALSAQALAGDAPTLVPVTAGAATAVLQAAADRPDGRYRRGERIVFRVTGTAIPAGADLEYDIVLDGGERLAQGRLRLGGETAVTAGPPGILWFQVRRGDRRAEAAAAVDPDAIRPSQPPPADFEAYWKARLAALAAVPVAPVLRPLTPPGEAAYQEWNAKWPVFGNRPRSHRAITLVEVVAPMGEGCLPARGYLAWPKGAAPGSLAGILFTHGAGIGDSDLAKTCAAAQHGFLAMDINAHGLLNGQPKSYYEAQANAFQASDGSAFKRGRLDQQSLYLATMYLRHRRALDVLCARPEWNGRDLMVRGASQGGALALACAGLDARVTRIAAGVPAFCDTTQPYSLNNWFLKPDDDPATVARVREAVRYVSLANFAPRCRAAAYFTVAFLDRSCHPATVYAAYNVYGGPKRLHPGPDATHGGIAQAIHYDAFSEFLRDPAPALRQE